MVRYMHIRQYIYPHRLQRKIIMKQLTPRDLNTLSKEDMAAMILQMQTTINTLSEQLNIINANKYGRKSEKLKVIEGQMSIYDQAFNEAEAVVDENAETAKSGTNAETAAEAEPEIETVIIHRKKHTGKREEDLKGFPTRIEKHELTEEQLTEIFGRDGWKQLPDEVYKRLEYQPAVYEVVEHHIAVYTAKKDDTIVRADRPADLLRNSVATPSLVAAVMNGKYANAMPLNRISEELARNDVNLSRGTLANWTIRCAERYLSLVYDRLKKHLCEQSVIQADETIVGVTKDGRPGTATSYMFVYRTSELQKENPVILYKYEKTRGHEHTKEFLNNFKGTVVSDAFSGYKALERENEGIISAFCWAHARRSYADALKALKGPEKKHSKDTVAHKALIKIGNIYNAENNAKSMSPDERYKYRQEKVLPLVEAYFAWVKEQNPSTILSEKTRDGLEYSLNNEKQLRTFLKNGMVPIDNSATERAIRPFTVGRANWHIIDTVHGAEASAVIYSLVETAKANNLKIYEYLKFLLEKIPSHMDDKNLDFIDDFLPWSPSLPACCRRS